MWKLPLWISEAYSMDLGRNAFTINLENFLLLVFLHSSRSLRSAPNCPKMASTSKPAISHITHKLKEAVLAETVVQHTDVDVSQELTNWDFVLITKVLYERTMSPGAAENHAKRIWQDVGNFAFSYHDRNMFIIRFDKEEDKNIVLAKKWSSLDGHLLLIHDWNLTMDASTLDWESLQISFTLLNLPPEHQNRVIVDRMGTWVGKVVDVHPPNAMPQGNQKVKVTVNVTVDTPWRRGMKVRKLNGQDVKVIFYYINQPYKICPKCYVCNHNRTDCPKIQQILIAEDSQIQDYFAARRAPANVNVPNIISATTTLAPSHLRIEGTSLSGGASNTTVGRICKRPRTEMENPNGGDATKSSNNDIAMQGSTETDEQLSSSTVMASSQQQNVGPSQPSL